MRLLTETDELLQGFDFWRMFKWGIGLALLVTSCFAISVVGFLRKDLGERYYGPVNLFFGYTVVANFAFFGNLIGVASGHPFSWLMVLFWLGFVAASIYHRKEISRKNKAGEAWHSMCHGTPLLTLGATEEATLKIWEPLIVFLAGLLSWKFSFQLGLWLAISGVSLLINRSLCFAPAAASRLPLCFGGRVPRRWTVGPRALCRPRPRVFSFQTPNGGGEKRKRLLNFDVDEEAFFAAQKVEVENSSR